MTDEMFDFLLEELKKDVLINEPLSIEIKEIITCNNFPEYYSFLDFAKDNMLTNGTTYQTANRLVRFVGFEKHVMLFFILVRLFGSHFPLFFLWF
ncbi:MAG: hypothetical protein MR349_02105 [Spirochaetia bacterium]|nr:hypothetical protein [Spirochaetia bacterium]